MTEVSVREVSPATPGALYDRIGGGYGRYRRPDPRIAARVHRALGDAASLVNVGAGAGSYEPADRTVVAVEPSAAMVAQRPAGAAPVVRATADALPLRDRAADAAMGILTIHHWPDWRAGVAEMLRVSRSTVVLLTWDPDFEGFWLARDYLPGIIARDRATFPPVAELADALGGAEVTDVPVPRDCTDGFLCAYWARPAAYLDPGVRGAISALAVLHDAGPAMARLAEDVASGAWARRNAAIVDLPELGLGYRLVVARR